MRRVNVDVSEIHRDRRPLETSGGLEGTILPESRMCSNPEVDNPEVDNPEVDNPEVDNAEVYNPEVDNPEVDNPEVDNPEVDNPEVDNPEVDNPKSTTSRWAIRKWTIRRSTIPRSTIRKSTIRKSTIPKSTMAPSSKAAAWSPTSRGRPQHRQYHDGLQRQSVSPASTLPRTGTAQLLVYRVYKTPIIKATSCDVKTMTQNVLIAEHSEPDAGALRAATPATRMIRTRTTRRCGSSREAKCASTLRVLGPDAAEQHHHRRRVDRSGLGAASRTCRCLLQPQPVNTPDIRQ